jgi:hypothetical protein
MEETHYEHSSLYSGVNRQSRTRFVTSIDMVGMLVFDQSNRRTEKENAGVEVLSAVDV